MTGVTLSRRKAIGIIGFGFLAAPIAIARALNESTDALQSLHYLTLTEIAEMIKSRRISSTQLTKLILDRIATLDGRLNSYITVMKDSAIAAAENMDKELARGKYRGPLHGVPIGIKDLLFTTNAPTSGSHAFNRNFIAPYNATVVKKLYEAGAVIVGKLNLTEGAMGGYHESWRIPRNPWGEDLWTGVSSSGSGIATAAGLCFGSIGSDTGGSIRFPSVANAIVGLKPTYGLVSRYGVMPLAESMDHVGPMTRSVMDAAIMLEAIAGHDPNDHTSLRTQRVDLTGSISKGVAGLRIGIDPDYTRTDIDPAIASAVEAAVEKLRSLGATVVHVKMPVASDPDAWFTITGREVYEANKKTFPSRRDEYGLSFRELLDFGSTVTTTRYDQCVRVKETYKQELSKVLASVDALAAPAGGMTRGVTDEMWKAKDSENVIGKYFNSLGFQFGFPANFAGTPSLTLPCGKGENGLPPPGFQLMGGALTEAMLCRIGYAYEQATEWHKQHPDL